MKNVCVPLPSTRRALTENDERLGPEVRDSFLVMNVPCRSLQGFHTGGACAFLAQMSARHECVGYADSKDFTHDVFIPARARPRLIG